ncbi:hypothetical protein ES708_11527 [subsurface metagenome]
MFLAKKSDALFPLEPAEVFNLPAADTGADVLAVDAVVVNAGFVIHCAPLFSCGFQPGRCMSFPQLGHRIGLPDSAVFTLTNMVAWQCGQITFIAHLRYKS